MEKVLRLSLDRIDRGYGSQTSSSSEEFWLALRFTNSDFYRTVIGEVLPWGLEVEVFARY